MYGHTNRKIGEKGRGVFASRNFRKGENIEICNVVRVPSKDRNKIDKTILYNYYFAWGKDIAIALGNGSLYNHSYLPNATYKKFLRKEMLKFVAIKNIRKGEEITTNYNGRPNVKTALWFKTK